MFRLWAKEFKDNRMLRDTTICDDSGETRTHKVFHALEEVCYVFDLGKPIWLEHNIDEFKRHAKARFYQDSFIEQIDFDFLEIQVIEESFKTGKPSIVRNGTGKGVWREPPGDRAGHRTVACDQPQYPEHK